MNTAINHLHIFQAGGCDGSAAHWSLAQLMENRVDADQEKKKILGVPWPVARDPPPVARRCSRVVLGFQLSSREST